jgi:glycosyltransferase involved in cell wall biosynthesis
MRVLHVINSLILAGVETLIAEMLPRMRERGLDVELALLKPLDSPLEDRLHAAGVPFVEDMPKRIYSPLHIPALARKLKKYDLAQANLFPAQLWLAMAKQISGASLPLVTTEQSTHSRRRRAIFRPLDRWMYNRYAAIACNSSGTLESLAAWVPSAKSRLSIVPNGVPLERFQSAAPANKAEIIGSNAPLAIFVARFESAKDHTTLLRAVAPVGGLHLALVGDGPLRPAMEALSASLAISSRVHFLGRRADVPSLLKMADVYVHSSNWEGFGIAAVEAMAAGLPVIASKVAGLAEVVEGAGLLFELGDHVALAARIQSVLDSIELRDRLVQASRRRAQDFSIERTVDGYVEIYRRLLKDSASS